jgi:Zn-dependent M28 family amino/carboxypeptidase
MPRLRRPFAATLLTGLLALAACGITPPSVAPSASADASAADSAGASGVAATPYPLPSIDLGGEISAAAITRHLEAFEAIAQEHGGVRAIGTPGYEASVDYVVAELGAIGYQVTTPQFGVPTFAEAPGGTVSVLDGGPTFEAGDDTHAMIYSADGDVTARVATVGFPDSDGGEGNRGCSEGEWEEFPTGRIALTPPGPCLRRDTVEHAQEAGAVALVVANDDWEPGEALRPTLLVPDGIDIPVISAIGEVGAALTEAADQGTEVRIQVDTQVSAAAARNVVAQHGSGEPVVMLGAHLDSVLDGPGINDNGSGVAAVLEIAHLLADAGHPGTLRVGLWAAEEFGLHGSRDYVSSLAPGDVDAMAAYINLDMLGSLNAVPMVYANLGAPDGSSEITEFLLAWLQADGVAAVPEDLGSGSDHFFFAQAGVPIGGIFSGASEEKSEEQAAANGGQAGEPMDPCYHLACDTIDNVNADQTATYAQAVAATAMALLGGQLTAGQ